MKLQSFFSKKPAFLSPLFSPLSPILCCCLPPTCEWHKQIQPKDGNFSRHGGAFIAVAGSEHCGPRPRHAVSGPRLGACRRQRGRSFDSGSGSNVVQEVLLSNGCAWVSEEEFWAEGHCGSWAKKCSCRPLSRFHFSSPPSLAFDSGCMGVCMPFMHAVAKDDSYNQAVGSYLMVPLPHRLFRYSLRSSSYFLSCHLLSRRISREGDGIQRG